MNVNFLDGSARQRELFNQTVQRSLFPWDWLATTVNVTWVDQIRDGDANFVTFARVSGNWQTALMKIDKDLESGAGLPAQFQGDDFVRDVIHHELGHVAAFSLDGAAHATLTSMLGAPAWTVQDAGAWADAGEEAAAETFKDVFLRKPNRKFDNRTRHRLTEARFQDYLDTLQQLCPLIAP